jgi:hypothetical protein
VEVKRSSKNGEKLLRYSITRLATRTGYKNKYIILLI